MSQLFSHNTTYSPDTNLGLVIGTFAAVPYIHLQLEARSRLYPDVPVLIHDDGSRQQTALRELADRYGADFITFPSRRRHHLGDLNVYPTALEWCRERAIRYLLKLSRRWVWQTDWRDDLRELFAWTGAPTVSNYTVSYGYGFRTECVAFDVKAWTCHGFFHDVQQRLEMEKHVFVENYIHVWAQRLSLEGSPRWQQWQLDHPVPEDRKGYAPWTLMGPCRHERTPTRFWHNSHPPEEYAELASRWNLPYDIRDFMDPNAGEGDGEPCLT